MYLEVTCVLRVRAEALNKVLEQELTNIDGLVVQVWVRLEDLEGSLALFGLDAVRDDGDGVRDNHGSIDDWAATNYSRGKRRRSRLGVTKPGPPPTLPATSDEGLAIR